MKSFYSLLTLVLSVVCSVHAFAEITEKDLFIYGDMKKYKSDVVEMLNRLAVEHKTCKKKIKPNTAGISKSKSKPGNPAFFVQCGLGNFPEVVRFTLNDIKNNKVSKAKIPIKRKDALIACKNAAKDSSTRPSTVDFSVILGYNYDAKPNGNVVASSTFTASNAFGIKENFKIFCFFEGQKFVDVTVKPDR